MFYNKPANVFTELVSPYDILSKLTKALSQLSACSQDTQKCKGLRDPQLAPGISSVVSHVRRSPSLRSELLGREKQFALPLFLASGAENSAEEKQCVFHV